MAYTYVEDNGVEKPCFHAVPARNGARKLLILVYRDGGVTSEKKVFIEFDRNFALGVATLC